MSMSLRHKITSSEEGFTLLEMLVVLSILAIILLLFTALPQVRIEEEPLETFLETFEQDIFYLQQLTMTHQTRPSLLFSPSTHRYYITHSSMTIERSYDPDIQLRLNTIPNPFSFTTRGYTRQPGTFYVDYEDKTY